MVPPPLRLHVHLLHQLDRVQPDRRPSALALGQAVDALGIRGVRRGHPPGCRPISEYLPMTSPMLICYDGSEGARRAVDAAAELVSVVSGRTTVVLAVASPLTASQALDS